MGEWLLRCTDGLKSGAYYASVDIHDGEQPILVLFKKDGDKTIVVGHGEPVSIQPHGRLGDLDKLDFVLRNEAKPFGFAVYDCGITDGLGLARECLETAPTIIPASE